MRYYIAYGIMLMSFAYLGCQGADLKSKIIGFLCCLTNAFIFWR